MEAETLSQRLGDLDARALVITVAYTLAEVEAKIRLEAKALVHTLNNKLENAKNWTLANRLNDANADTLVLRLLTQ